MEFLLSSKEFSSLVSKEELEQSKKAIKELRSLFVPKCMHAVQKEGARRYSYCDQCPLSDIGNNKSDERPSRSLSKILCDLPRRYSK